MLGDVKFEISAIAGMSNATKSPQVKPRANVEMPGDWIFVPGNDANLNVLLSVP